MPDFEALKKQQRGVWSSGDYARVGGLLVPASERLCETLDPLPGERLLDVATGTGNLALAAARRACRVTGVDFMAGLLERARLRAASEAVDIDWVQGDAERLPFRDACFDVVASVFGVMFAPDQETAARELLRVCRSGGRIALACWTPGGFFEDQIHLRERFAPRPADLPNPDLWGTEAHLRRLFGDAIGALRAVRRTFVWRFPSEAAFLEFATELAPPAAALMRGLDAAQREAFRGEILRIARRHDRAQRDILLIPTTYLEAVVMRR